MENTYTLWNLTPCHLLAEEIDSINDQANKIFLGDAASREITQSNIERFLIATNHLQAPPAVRLFFFANNFSDIFGWAGISAAFNYIIENDLDGNIAQNYKLWLFLAVTEYMTDIRLDFETKDRMAREIGDIFANALQIMPEDPLITLYLGLYYMHHPLMVQYRDKFLNHAVDNFSAARQMFLDRGDREFALHPSLHLALCLYDLERWAEALDLLESIDARTLEELNMPERVAEVREKIDTCRNRIRP